MKYTSSNGWSVRLADRVVDDLEHVWATSKNPKELVWHVACVLDEFRVPYTALDARLIAEAIEDGYED